MSIDQKTEILFRELDLTHSSITDTWKVYMTWFTFFFTANLVVMSWIFTKPELRSDSIWILSLFWILFNTTGSISSFWVAKYSSDANQRMKEILAVLNSEETLLKEEPAFPRELSVFGARANGVALIANIIAWSYILFKFGIC